MIIAVKQSNFDPNTWGYHYGYAGIYVGNGYVVDSTSFDGAGVKTYNTLEDWIAGYDAAGTVMWGYPDSVLEDMGLLEEKETPGESEKTEKEITGVIRQDNSILEADIYRITSVPVTPETFWELMGLVPEVNKEALVALGIESYGLNSRWMEMLIGTTAREGYVGDPYLYYAWACAILNDYRWYTADAMYWRMSGWGGVMCPACGAYYSEHAIVYGCGYHASYSNVYQDVLKCIYLALVNRDYRIFEVDGMVDISSSTLGLIYNSPVYNCQVWSW